MLHLLAGTVTGLPVQAVGGQVARAQVAIMCSQSGWTCQRWLCCKEKGCQRALLVCL